MSQNLVRRHFILKMHHERNRNHGFWPECGHVAANKEMRSGRCIACAIEQPGDGGERNMELSSCANNVAPKKGVQCR